MSNLLLTQVVASYISSWEGHTQAEGNNFIRLRDRLKTATIDEINTEYNTLTQQQLWSIPLLDLFYDEIRDRMFDNTTFAISTAWRTVDDWKKNPFVLIRVGFEESYSVIDNDGSYILADDPNISSFTLMNDSFSDEFGKRIIRLLLHHNINAIVQIGINEGQHTGRIQIVGIESSTDPDDRVSFLGTGLPSINGETIRIEAIVQEAADWRLIDRMYEALRSETPTILDPNRDKLINQLIDIQEAQNIIDDGGLTFEGNKIIEAKEPENTKNR
jgi:hypothetical protein